MFLSLVLALAGGGCSRETVPESAGPQAAEPASTEPLRLYNWDNYISPWVLEEFKKETGIAIITEVYFSNEEMIATIEGGDSGFDLVCPSDYAVQIMQRKRLLAELDPGTLPLLGNLHSRFANVYYDPTKTYSVPYMWGTTGLGFNRLHLPKAPRTWAEVLDPKWLKKANGKVLLLDDPRETLAIALFSLGYSANTSDPAELAAAERLLSQALPWLAGFDSEEYYDRLNNGEVWAAQGWDGDFYDVFAANSNLDFVLPEPTVILSVDNMAILAESDNKRNAAHFINFLLRRDIAVRNAADTGFRSCVEGARESGELADGATSGTLHLLPESQAGYEMLRELEPEIQELYDAIWERLQKQAEDNLTGSPPAASAPVPAPAPAQTK